MPLTSKGFPLFLTFDLDAETMWTGRDPSYAGRPILMSQGAYGWKVGTTRVLDLLDRYGLKTTFFIPGLVIDQRAALMQEILRRGHEIAHHSYSHAWILNLTPEQEREEMEKGFQSIRRVSGRAPRGWRSPAAEISPITMPMLVEYGFDYSSNFFDDDSPYLHDVEGRCTKIVELPFRWVLDDAPFFQYSIVLPGRTMQAPSALLEAWKGAGGPDRARAEASKCLDRALRRDGRGYAARPRTGAGGGLAMSGALAGPHILVAGDEMVEDMRPGLERARAEALR
jgi:peptidoglycan/xylan/chitin deacetylase (PgdA/CDA1 family)